MSFHKGYTPWNKGNKMPLETRKKISISFKGLNTWSKGKKHTTEAKRKIGDAQKGRKNWGWKDGRSLKPGYKLYLNQNRRILRKNVLGSHTFAEWETLKAQYNWICPCCKRKEPIIKLSEDHIIPLSKGGSHNLENIQPLCRSCNSKKFTKIIKY